MLSFALKKKKKKAKKKKTKAQSAQFLKDLQTK